MDDEFSAIADQAIDDAQAVTCSREEFTEGLRTIIERVTDTLNITLELGQKKETEDV